MPYKDELKKKLYYERYKKSYDRDYKIKNRDKWNEYQKHYKQKNWIKIYEKIKKNKKPLTDKQLSGLNKYGRKYLKESVNQISDYYAKRQLIKSGIPPSKDAIEMKKLSITIFRLKKKIRQIENEKQN